MRPCVRYDGAMEKERYEQLRDIVALRVVTMLKDIARQQKHLRITLWLGMASLLFGMVILLGLMGALMNATQ
jgi:hypothetical protein